MLHQVHEALTSWPQWSNTVREGSDSDIISQTIIIVQKIIALWDEWNEKLWNEVREYLEKWWEEYLTHHFETFHNKLLSILESNSVEQRREHLIWIVPLWQELLEKIQF